MLANTNTPCTQYKSSKWGLKYRIFKSKQLSHEVLVRSKGEDGTQRWWQECWDLLGQNFKQQLRISVRQTESKAEWHVKTMKCCCAQASSKIKTQKGCCWTLQLGYNFLITCFGNAWNLDSFFGFFLDFLCNFWRKWKKVKSPLRTIFTFEFPLREFELFDYLWSAQDDSVSVSSETTFSPCDLSSIFLAWKTVENQAENNGQISVKNERR